MQAFVELLVNVESCHTTLEPNTTELSAIVPVVASVSVISKTWLEFSIVLEQPSALLCPHSSNYL